MKEMEHIFSYDLFLAHDSHIKTHIHTCIHTKTKYAFPKLHTQLLFEVFHILFGIFVFYFCNSMWLRFDYISMQYTAQSHLVSQYNWKHFITIQKLCLLSRSHWLLLKHNIYKTFIYYPSRTNFSYEFVSFWWTKTNSTMQSNAFQYAQHISSSHRFLTVEPIANVPMKK